MNTMPKLGIADSMDPAQLPHDSGAAADRVAVGQHATSVPESLGALAEGDIGFSHLALIAHEAAALTESAATSSSTRNPCCARRKTSASVASAISAITTATLLTRRVTQPSGASGRGSHADDEARRGRHLMDPRRARPGRWGHRSDCARAALEAQWQGRRPKARPPAPTAWSRWPTTQWMRGRCQARR